MKKRMKQILSMMLIMVLFVTGCMTIEMPVYAAKKTSKKVTKIVLNTKKETTAVGCSLTLKVKSVKPANASKKVVWSSSNKKIATVSKKGVVKAKKTGTVTITAKSATDKKVTAKCKIKVYKATKKMKLQSEKSYTLEQGENITLKAKVTKPAKGYEPIKWSSKNTKVAKVNKKGKVTAVAAGKTTIIGQSGKKKVKVTITVKDKEEAQKPGNTQDSGESQKPGNTQTPGENQQPDNTDKPDNDQTTDNNQPSIGEDDFTSRAQWVSALVDKMGYSVLEESLETDPDTGKKIYSYADVSENENAMKIEAAVRNNIVPLEMDSDTQSCQFFPNEKVTREFAAVTAIRAIGYELDEELQSSDSEQLEYAQEVKAAVDRGLLQLKDNAFCPSETATEQELAYILQHIDSIMAGRVVDPNHEDVFVYADNVIEASEDMTDYTVGVSENSLIVSMPQSSGAEELRAGQIIMLPATEEFEDGFPFKIDSISSNNGVSRMTGHMPEDIFEVFEKIDMEGVASINPDDIVLAEGVEVVEEETLDNAKLDVDVDDDLDIDFEKTFEFDLYEKNYTGNLETKKDARLTFELPKIKYAFNLEGTKVNKLLIEVPASIELSYGGEAEWEGETEKKEKKIATIPIKLNGGFSLDVAVNLVAELDGTVKITYSIDPTFGVYYTAETGEVIPFKNTTQYASVEADATLKMGIKPLVEFDWMKDAKKRIAEKFGYDMVGHPLYTVGLSTGLGAHAETTIRTDRELLCVDFGAWYYLDLLIGVDSIIGEKVPILKHTFEIFDKDNSPLKIGKHLENKGEVPECTYEEEPPTILYSGTWYGLDWSIDIDGKFVISGEDSRTVPEARQQEYPSWLMYRGNIKSAVITAKNVKSTYEWFKGCNNLKSVNFNDFNTRNVVDMSEMFYECTGLSALDISDLSMLKVSDMSGMFYGCRALTVLKLSDSYTSNATDMSDMFNGCTKLTNLDVSKLDTSEVTNMASMFEGCSQLEKLALSNFDTSKVEDMNRMFLNCKSIVELDVSKWDTGKVTDMCYLFGGCSGLTKLDVSKWDTSRVTNMMCVFSKCKGLTELDLSNFDTSNVANMWGTFYECSNLTELEISNFDTGNVVDMANMFYFCSKLKRLEISNFDTGNVSAMNRMFYCCSGLEELDVSNFDTGNVENMSQMFEGCSRLTELNVSGFDTSNVLYMQRMFISCSGLTELNVSNFDIGNVSLMNEMFCYCSGIEELDLSSFDMGNVTNKSQIFYGCNSLSKIQAPLNVTASSNLNDVVTLPGGAQYVWMDSEGNIYTDLPANLTVSVELTRVPTPE